jgi:CubicO group peptidase (beta-lactamase class C family)
MTFGVLVLFSFCRGMVMRDETPEMPAGSGVMGGASAQRAGCGVGDLVQPYIDRGELAGAVLVIGDKTGPVSYECLGYADVGTGRRMTADTVFWIASVTKMFTAAAFMTLVDEGKVSLDDPVEKYLPMFKYQDMWVTAEQDENRRVLVKAQRAFTIREALSHTAGFLPVSPMQPTTDYLGTDDILQSYAMMPLMYQPGKGYRYHQAGFLIAAKIAEMLTGLPFDGFMDQRINKPLGLLDTTYWPSQEQVARMAQVHKPGPDGKGLVTTPIHIYRYPLWDRTRTPMPSGGLFSTGRDVERFARMLMCGGLFEGRRVMSEASVKEMTSRQTPEALPEVDGLGCQPGENSFGHGGMASNNTTVDTKLGISLTYLVAHFGFPGNGLVSRDLFFVEGRRRYAGRMEG